MAHNVLVLGAGAIGGLTAAKLSENLGLAVSLVVRRPTSSLVLTTDGVATQAPVSLVTSPVDVDDVDWVVIATKTYDVAGLASWLESPALANASVAVAQNGVEHSERVARWVPPERVLPVIVTYGAQRTEPGHIVQTLSGIDRVPDNELGRRFAALCEQTSLEVELLADFPSALWTKLAWNVVGNSLSTILDLPVRELGQRPELRWLAEQLVSECRAVARDHGAEIAPGLATEMLDLMGAYPASVRSSMWQDRDAGRQLEHEAISGAVARLGTAVGIDVPYCQMATRLLQAISSGAPKDEDDRRTRRH